MEANYTIRRRTIECELQFPESLHPVVQRIYKNRKLSNINDIKYNLDNLHDIKTLSGLDTAVDLLEHSIRSNRRILIVGDFDADGATSTALAIRALKSMGAKHVDYLVPNRFEYGYGLTPEIVEEAKQLQPDILITVDNGIASLEGVAKANRFGIQVIITDHHLPATQLPEAAAIVNPNLPGDTFPSKNLAGVGVIFYTLLGLRARLRDKGWFKEQNLPIPNMADLLDLVALGTVADVVLLDANNRILVEQGLKRIRAGKCVPGIKAMLQIGKRNINQIVATDLGFTVGPRLNAAGRLEDMSLGIECLLSDSISRATELASQLDQLNRERKEIEQSMQRQALKIIKDMSEKLSMQNLPEGICLYDANWHQGVVGLVASRIKEIVHRPVIAFALVSDNEIKGSARSIPGINVRDILDSIATFNPGLITKFGGHAMAAGLSMEVDKFTLFSNAFANEIKRVLAKDQVGQAIILTDGELSHQELNIKTAEALRYAGPWGQGFPEPVFDGLFTVKDKRVVGERHLKLVLQAVNSKQAIDAIAFNQDISAVPNNVDKIHIAYRLEVNDFRGVRNIQLNVQYIKCIS